MKMLKGFVAIAALMSSVPGMAAVTIFFDEDEFNAAAGSTTTEDFEDGELANGLSIDTDAGAIANGLFNDRLTPGGATTTFNFSSPITAFGGLFDLAGPGGQGTGIEVVLGGGANDIFAIPNTTTGFFGFTSTDPFASVLFRTGNQEGIAETYNISSLQFGGTTAAVPEPGTWAMLLLGFFAVGGALRRSRKAVSFRTAATA